MTPSATAAVGTPKLRFRALWLAIGWALVATVIFLSLTPHPPQAGLPYEDKFEHILAYGTLMLWFAQLYREAGRRLWIGAAFVAMGVGLEFVQGFSGYRQFEYADMVANSLGVVAGFLLALTRLDMSLAFVEARFAPSTESRSSR
jgi:VanZ family protein